MKESGSGWWLAAVIIVLLIRFASLSTYPLTDTTEARYGEIARVMATSGNWITPQLEPGEPFWAKPPLSFWQGALSVSLLGTSEFSVRLPMFLNLLAVLGIAYGFAWRLSGHRLALISTFIIITSVVGFVTSGAVMTDPAMMLSTTLAMISFWYAFEQGSRRWGYCFFIALVIGFLAKGPVAWVLTGVPIVLWLTLHRRWGELWPKIPVLNGICVVILLTLPWFVLSELKTPGFLNYFFVGEHLQRFVDSGWTGDRYGTAHDERRGTIWLFTFAAFAPWSIAALVIGAAKLLKFRTQPLLVALSPVHHYLILWCLWPSIFFTFSGNILPTYVLPALPAFAILLAMAIKESRKSLLLIVPGLFLPTVVVFAGPLGIIDQLRQHTQRALIHYAQNTYPTIPMAYVGEIPHSARFYSRGTVKFFPDVDSVHAWSQCHVSVLIAAPESTRLPEALNTVFLGHIARWNSYDLYLLNAPDIPITSDSAKSAPSP